MKDERLFEKSLCLLAGSQKTDGNRPRFEAHHSNPRRIAPKGSNILLDPAKRRYLIQKTKIQRIRIGIPARNLRKINETEDAETVIEGDTHSIWVNLVEMRSVQQRISRTAIGKITMMKDHNDRLLGLRLLGRYANIKRQAILALPVMFQ